VLSGVHLCLAWLATKVEITLVGLGPGFVSWALQTKLSVGRPLKAYEFGASVYASRISADELRHGDIITQ
jgi:hypothetical protein